MLMSALGLPFVKRLFPGFPYATMLLNSHTFACWLKRAPSQQFLYGLAHAMILICTALVLQTFIFIFIFNFYSLIYLVFLLYFIGYLKASHALYCTNA